MKVTSRFSERETENVVEVAPIVGGRPAPDKAFNVCGVLVHAAEGRVDEVTQALAELPGVEIHAETEDGRLVVTIEDTEEALAADTMVLVNRADGVVNSSLVYHQFEPHDTLELEEVSS